MFRQIFQKLTGVLGADISSTTTLIPVDIDLLTDLQTGVDFNSGEWTYLLLFDGVLYEEVRVKGTTGEYLIVDRGTSGSTPQVFSAVNTTIVNSFGRDAIRDIVADNPVPVDFSVEGTGLVSTERVGNDVTVNVDAPNFQSKDGVQVLGQWPNITFGLEIDAGGCCPGDGVGGGEGTGEISLTINSEILQGNYSGGVITLTLPTPVFNGSDGVTVTGEWPNFNIQGSGVGGGSGTVTEVATGDGLTVTGNPNINPTISITNTGVLPGDYAGLVINERGQIEQVPVGFAPISEIEIADAGGTVVRLGGKATVTLAPADVGVPGIAPLADPAGPADPLDESSVVTPALLMATVGTNGGGAAGSQASEPDASYTTAAGSAVALDLAAGKSALMMGEVIVLDNAAPLTPVAYGIGVFDATSSKKYGAKILTQSRQTFVAKIDGPFNGVLNIVTTALPVGSVLQGATLAVIKL